MADSDGHSDGHGAARDDPLLNLEGFRASAVAVAQDDGLEKDEHQTVDNAPPPAGEVLVAEPQAAGEALQAQDNMQDDYLLARLETLDNTQKQLASVVAVVQDDGLEKDEHQTVDKAPPPAGEVLVAEPQAAGEALQAQDIMLDDYLLARLETLDSAQKQLFRNTLLSGQFKSGVLDYLTAKRMWTQLHKYLKKCVVLYAASSIVLTPDGASTDEVVGIHAELFLSAHKAQVMDLIAYHIPSKDSGVPRRYFDEHVLPLWESVPEDRKWLHERFDYLNQMVNLVMPLPSLAESPDEASTEIRDYMYLYFPELRPPLELVRGQQQSLVWRFGEKLWMDGTRGFRCFSCHKVFRASGAGRLRAHLEGGSTHQGRCPAVLPCTLQSLALLIPHA